MTKKLLTYNGYPLVDTNRDFLYRVVADIVPPTPPQADYRISGAGREELNGDYTEAGIRNSRPYYDGPNNYRISWDTTAWIVTVLFAATPDYYTFTNTPVPPSGEIWAYFGAGPPNPLVVSL